jgi:hypothetical protein
MKAETADISQSEASTAVSSPDTVSLIDQTDSSVTRDNDGDDAAVSSTVASSTPTVDTASVTGKSKKSPSSFLDKQAPSAETEGKPTDLVGKINNLVSTDLSNIVDGRDFLLVCEPVFVFFVIQLSIFLVVGAPLQIGLSIWFLYNVLGWRSVLLCCVRLDFLYFFISAIVGLAVMIVLFPVPGYFAKLMGNIQATKMKKVCFKFPSVSFLSWAGRDSNSRTVDRR